MTGNQLPAIAGRQRMIEQYLPLARSLARRYRHGGEPFEDLEQTAYVGLVKAVDRFDPERGAFPAFAVPTILGELRRHFRDRGWAVKVPRRIQERSLAVERATDALSAVLMRAPTAAEIAERTGLTVEEVLEAHQAAAGHRSLSLLPEALAEDDPRVWTDPGALDDGYARAEERATLVTMLETLKPHEREIVLLRFHNELSQREIGRRVGISQMGVSRILRRSLDRMRTAAE
jgi:RNA polymerase sigma-B factor